MPRVPSTILVPGGEPGTALGPKCTVFDHEEEHYSNRRIQYYVPITTYRYAANYFLDPFRLRLGGQQHVVRNPCTPD